MMNRRFAFATLLAAAFVTATTACRAQVPTTASPAPTASSAEVSMASLAPLPPNSAPLSSHAPFEAGDCKLCHQNADPKQPGPIVKKGTAICLDCHEEFVDVMKRPHTHRPARSKCTECHNPHNAAQPRLLRMESGALCLDCHGEIEEVVTKARVKHGALSTGKKCVGCHNPHASTVDKLLVQLPFDLCLSCHDDDRLTDAGGKKLQNLKAWLENNKVWHAPVEKKDCSACHQPHGGDHFRLLKEDYPQTFYAPFSARTYALCFSCHREAAFSSEKTTTLTNFRDGPKNLHYVHLQQAGKGRTCRACHEVHASRQALHIRDGVPFGSSGWILKLNYKKTATGGSCEKTCHQERSYDNRNPG